MPVSKETLSNLVGELDLKMKCFIHRKTHEIVSYPDEYLIGDTGDTVIEEVWQEEFMKIKSDPKNYIEVPRMTSSESFRVMEAFAEQTKDRSVKIRLLQALDGEKPFSHFMQAIHNMGKFREEWFAFHKQKTMEWLDEKISPSLL